MVPNNTSSGSEAPSFSLSLPLNTNNLSTQIFGLAFCHLIDFPKSGKECSKINPNMCVQCLIHGAYFTGESINNYKSTALLINYIIWILTILFAFFGVLGNILIILVFRGRRTKRSFEFLLILLASVDIFCSFSSVFAATGCIAFFGNWLGRGKISLYWYWLSAIGLFGRSCSTLFTVLITIERYLMITYPLQATRWYTPNKMKLMSLVVLFFAIFLNYPRFASLSVEPNNFRDIPSFAPFEYVIKETSQGIFWYVTLDGWTDKIDNWLFLPIILLFNLLSWWKVHQHTTRSKKHMNTQEKMDIRAVRMFMPVVVIYFLTNFEPIVNYLIIHFHAIAYRELYMLLILSIAVNAAVNLPIYYFRSSSFKKETGAVMKKLRMRFFPPATTGAGNHGSGVNKKNDIALATYSASSRSCDVLSSDAVIL